MCKISQPSSQYKYQIMIFHYMVILLSIFINQENLTTVVLLAKNN